MRNHTGEDHLYAKAMRIAEDPSASLEQVAALLVDAHEAGDARATYALATWYLHGKYFRKDIRKATMMLRRAAAADVPSALFDLAVSYENGVGLRTNLQKAAELYVRAALKGDKQAVYEAGRCFYYGLGVSKDRRIARVWLDHAEHLAVPEALRGRKK